MLPPLQCSVAQRDDEVHVPSSSVCLIQQRKTQRLVCKVKCIMVGENWNSK